MKFVAIFFVVLFSVSFIGYSSAVTVLDSLRDGFDAVYKLEEFLWVSFDDQLLVSRKAGEMDEVTKSIGSETFDVYVRKSSIVDPNKFILHLKNGQQQRRDEELFSERDIEAFVLPIIVTTIDFNIDQIYATETDTRDSLYWKNNAMDLLLHNMTAFVDELDEMGDTKYKYLELDHTGPYGDCEVEVTFKNMKDLFGFEVNTSRDDCSGDLKDNILGLFNNNGAWNYSGGSTLQYEFVFDKETKQFLRNTFIMKGSLVGEDEIHFISKRNIYFDSYREIEEVFDEAKNTKMYKKADIEKMQDMKGSTVIDSLKDGFDAVYKYEDYFSISHEVPEDHSYFSYKTDEEDSDEHEHHSYYQNSVGQTFDVHLRKTSKNDPDKSILYLRNVQIFGEHESPPTKSDFRAFVLPTIVTTRNENADIDEIHVRQTDTTKSLVWKYDATMMLVHNWTDQFKKNGMKSKYMDLRSTNMGHYKGLELGDCETQVRLKSTKDQVSFEMSTSRDVCTGNIKYWLRGVLDTHNAKDVADDSTLKYEYYFDIKTGQFLRATWTIKGRLVGEHDLGFSMGRDIYFDGYQDIEKVFDETKIKINLRDQ